MSKDEFYCQECGHNLPLSEKGNATKNGEPYEACKDCCHEEQKKQFYAGM